MAKKRFVWEHLGYTPTPAALVAHEWNGRFTLVAGGERGSKSYSAAMEAAPAACYDHLLGWIVGPTYELARPEFEYVLAALEKLNLVVDASFPKQGPASLKTVLGTEVVTRSADDPVKLAAKAPDWILLCEAAQCNFETYLRVRGRVAEKRGWLWMSGTFEGSLGWYPEMWTRWQADNPEGGKSFSLPTWSNAQLFPQGEDDEELQALKRTLPHDVYLERFGGVPCPPSNLVLKGFSHLAQVSERIAYNARFPVEVWLDPGYSGSYYAVEFVQLVPRDVTREVYPDLPATGQTDVWVVDELYAQNQVTHQIVNAAKELDFWDRIKSGVGDIAARQHQGQSSVYETWLELAGIALEGEHIEVEDNVARHVTFLKDPLTGAPRIFYNPRCKGVLGEYGRWKRKSLGENRYGEPEKTDCDALKAIGYGLIARFGVVDPRQRKLKRRKSNPYDRWEFQVR